jgi:tRNA G10  N-methylase Trm11
MDARKMFLIELHEIMKQCSDMRNLLVNPFEDNHIWDEFKLSEEEKNTLKKYHFDDVALSAIEKTVRNTLMYAFFRAFAIIDGAGSPTITKGDKTWLGFTLRERKVDQEEDNEEFLHDALFETYWDWLEQKNKDEKLL